ncbi:MAG: TOMM precursor leader peptide-binding protein, partial [Paludibaculum sp.]
MCQVPILKFLSPRLLRCSATRLLFLKLLGGDADDRLRFWEIIKGITTPIQLEMASHQLDVMQNMVKQVPSPAPRHWKKQPDRLPPRPQKPPRVARRVERYQPAGELWGSPTDLGLITILLLGPPSEKKLAARLRRSFGAAGVRHGTEWIDASAPHLVVCWCGFEREAARALAAGAICVGADFRNAEALLGPIALPDRAGCPACAQARLFAASQQLPEEDDAGESKALAIPLLIREIRAILRKGPLASPLLDHILAVDTRALTSSYHRVIPLPDCEVCGGASLHPGEPARPADGDVF